MKSRKRVNGYIIHLDEPLGQGTYGTVYRCTQESSQTIYAVKVMDKSLCTRYLKSVSGHQYMAESLKRELAIHCSLHHNNIVRVVTVISTSNNYYVVQECCSDGDLRQLIVEQQRMPEDFAINCIQQICAGFQPLIERAILHRDLKPQNIVRQDRKLKLTDFGFAKALTSGRQMTQTVIGSPLYMSPQLLMKRPYSSKCDVWSVGVIFYQLLIGHHPWKANSMGTLLKAVLDSPTIVFPSGCHISDSVKIFIQMCLEIEQGNRFSWLEVYEQEIMGPELNKIGHEWRNSYHEAADRLDWLKENTQLQKLVGIFLREQVSTLTFELFTAIIKKLLPGISESLFGPMYQLFDKDSNGVIDFAEFVGGLSQCPEQVLQTFSKLLLGGHYYNQLREWGRLKQLCTGEDEEVVDAVYYLVRNMDMS